MMRVTEGLVAVRRWQLDHGGAPPPSLAVAMTEAGWPRVPIDPYDDRPIRFAVVDAQPTVYSIGQDGRDEGGMIDNTRSPANGDVLLRLPKTLDVPDAAPIADHISTGIAIRAGGLPPTRSLHAPSWRPCAGISESGRASRRPSPTRRSSMPARRRSRSARPGNRELAIDGRLVDGALDAGRCDARARGWRVSRGGVIPLSGSLTTTRGAVRGLATVGAEFPASLGLVAPSDAAGGSQTVPPGAGPTGAHGGAP